MWSSKSYVSLLRRIRFTNGPRRCPPKARQTLFGACASLAPARIVRVADRLAIAALPSRIAGFAALAFLHPAAESFRIDAMMP